MRRSLVPEKNEYFCVASGLSVYILKYRYYEFAPYYGHCRIGGCLYENVTIPLMLEDEPAVLLGTASDETTTVNCNIRDNAGRIIVKVKNNVVLLYDKSLYMTTYAHETRVVNSATGKRVLVIKYAPTSPKCVVDVSFITFTLNGAPIIFHPNRTVIPSTVIGFEIEKLTLANISAYNGCILYAVDRGGSVTLTDVHFCGGQTGIAVNSPSISTSYSVFTV